MTMHDIINRLDAIRDEAYWQSGCSHQDVLQESLVDIEKQLATLIKEIKEGTKNV